MRLSLVVAGTALLAGTLTACGGGDGGNSSNYCKDLKSAHSQFGSLTNPDVSKLDNAFTIYHKLSAEAPGAIKDDWKTVDGAVNTIQKTFEAAGLKFSDLSKLKAGSKSTTIDPTKIAGLVSQLSKLNTPEFTKAADAITSHAKNTCHVTLN